jgi:FKBP-type peptidyl-prolyl cis-trans isomerase SlyD
MAIKKGDFIEIVYTGRVKDTNEVFDTNDAESAKKAGKYDAKASYKPIVICVGETDVLKGLDESFVGKEPGKSYSIDVPAEQGFGKKLPQLVQMMSLAKFQKENIMPIPGLQLNFGDATGTIKAVSGGRVMVDFNHPLAGKNLAYDVSIKRVITDDAEKLNGFLEFYLGTNEISAELKEGKAEIKTKFEMPEQVKRAIREKVLKRIPSIREVSFIEEKKHQPAGAKEEKKQEKK